VLEVVPEGREIRLAREVVLVACPPGDRLDDAADELPDAVLALRRPQQPRKSFETRCSWLLRQNAGTSMSSARTISPRSLRS
jgi:hypothetical protein